MILDQEIENFFSNLVTVLFVNKADCTISKCFDI